MSTERPCPTPRKSIDLGQLAVLEDLHVVGAQIAHRLAALIGQPKIELDAAIRVEVGTFPFDLLRR